MKRLTAQVTLIVLLLALSLVQTSQTATAEEIIYLPIIVKPEMATVFVNNDTGSTLCYIIYDSGIGQKCFTTGVFLYGSFPVGTYTYRAEASCGVANGSRYFGPGVWEHTFVCATSTGDSQSLQGTSQSAD